MTAPKSGSSWLGIGSLFVEPPEDFWPAFSTAHSFTDNAAQIEELKLQSEHRANEFSVPTLPPPEGEATRILDAFAAEGWVEKEERWCCPQCQEQLGEAEAQEPTCPSCEVLFQDHGGLVQETVYVRDLAAIRPVDWVVAIHGMNTAGAWQEEFSWLMGSTWGRSVPVAVYKYGIVITGVLLFWRRRQLLSDFRAKLDKLRQQAVAQNLSDCPDLIAHSFGTWLFGHLLEGELHRPKEERLRFGRVILTGCVLRPDFDWQKMRDAGLVEEVLNHYGTKDPVVPVAHLAIVRSGPSGRRGFDSEQVWNIRAANYGHSSLFAIDRFVVDGKPLQKTPGENGVRHLEHSYQRYWRPFLTLPAEELGRIPDRANPKHPWKALPWPLSGNLFPYLAVPLLLALIVFLVPCLHRLLDPIQGATKTFLKYGGLGLLAVLSTTGLIFLGRWILGRGH
ncbi:MAG: hypothetical protein K0U98_00445 [Deltaproteobacteria bacterium]|nr:hypothetical protein [Deltaproteobacteria bacterium]